MQTEALYQALLTTFERDRSGDSDPAADARGFANILCAFAAVMAGPTSSVQGVELVADDTPGLILAELQKQTALLTTLCQHQDDAAALADACTRHPPLRTAEPIQTSAGPAPTYNPVTGSLGYWQPVVGSLQPVWIERQPQTRTPEPEAQAAAGSHSQAGH